MAHASRSARTFAGLVPALVLLWSALSAHADSPTFSFAPDPLVLGSGPSCLAGTVCGAIIATPTTGGATCTQSQLTSVNCSLVVNDGDGSMTLGLQAFAANCQNATQKQLNVDCAPGGSVTNGTVSCSVKRIESPTPVVTNVAVVCPTLASPQFGSSPGPGGTINLSTAAGSTTSTTLVVSNTGQASLSVTPAALAAPLSIQPLATTSVAVNAQATLTITCAPSAAGSTSTQTLALQTNDGSQAAPSYTVSCSAPAAPTPEFESTPLGAITSTRPVNGSAQFTVTNTGSGTLTITSVVGLGAPFGIAPASANIAGGSAQVFTVTCAGATAGSFSDGFALATNDSNEPSVDYQAACTILAPEIDPQPAAGTTLGLATVVGSNATTSVTLRNLQPFANGNLTVGALAPPGAQLTVSPSAGFAVAPGAQQVLTITCIASSANTFTGTLIVDSNDQDEPQLAFPIRCEVRSAGTPAFGSSIVAPGPLAIQTSQGTNATASLTVTNGGTAGLDVQLTGAPAAPVSVAPTGPVALAQGQSQVYVVTCNAASAGTFARQLTFSTNDPQRASVTFNVDCNVAANAPEYASTPAAPGNFSITTTQGTNASASLTVRNDGSGNLTVGSISGAAAPLSVAPGSATIAPAGAQVFTVTCSGANAGTFARSFTVNTNDASESAVAYSVACVVNGRPPELAPIPAAGSTIALTAVVGASAQSSIVLGNIASAGPADLAVATSGTSPPLTVAPPNAIVPVGASQTLTITCTPSAAGTIQQTLSVQTNDADEGLVTYVLRCTGLAPEFDSSPPLGIGLALSVGDAVGTVTAPIRVDNVGTASLDVAASGLSGALSVSPPGSSIAPGASVSFNVTCSSSVGSSTLQTLSLANNDSDEGDASFPVRCSRAEPFVPPTLSAVQTMAIAASPPERGNGIFKNGFE